MQQDLLQNLKEIYQVDDFEIENLKSQVLANISATKVENSPPKCIIIAGQVGSFKEALNQTICEELSENVIHLSLDELREYHPKANQIRLQTPELFLPMTQDLALILFQHLENFALEKGLNVILSSSLNDFDKVSEKLKTFQDKNYQTELLMVSINKMYSYLNAEERYEDGLLKQQQPILVSKQYHDQIYENIPTVFQQLLSTGKLDKVKIYRLDTTPEGNTLQLLTDSKNTAVSLYLEERSRDFNEIETQVLQQKTRKIRDLKVNREVNFLEKIRFEANMRVFLDDKKQKAKSSKKKM
ncbi:zeta toxin family protein [Arcicella sp. LKC2W]|uniref:zeta toxin family protein n=1 Tax=Arcicella sp. LKC2W TaxID=2984198 RepID=UPI002B1EC450|nr:zeta toxin family protein [Arcicella sp. LKC2W]MEA5461626.1 zeta toxin family protein [Arcicella sp. LKC2W]